MRPEDIIDAVARIVAEYTDEWEWPGNVAPVTLAKYRGIAERAIAKVDSARAQSSTALDLSILGRREREVVQHLARGLRLSAVAGALGISKHTARNHLKHAFRKLGVTSQIELLARIGGRQ